jgi:hypothetical protein
MQKRNLNHLALSLIYCFFLQLIPRSWSSDHVSYINYVLNSEGILKEYLDGSFFTLIFNEPVWLIINWILANIGDPEIVVRLLIFLSSFSLSFTLFTRSRISVKWIILILIFPPILTLNVEHLRQAMALSFFVVGYFSVSKFKNVLIFLSPFIHSSFFVSLPIIFLDKFLNRTPLKSFILFKLFLVLGYIIIATFYMKQIATILGAVQAQHDFSALSNTGNGFIFWIAILLLFLSSRLKKWNEDYIAISIILLYLISYFFNPMVVRVFDPLVFFIFIAAYSFNKLKRRIFVSAIVFYSVFTYAIITS